MASFVVSPMRPFWSVETGLMRLSIGFEAWVLPTELTPVELTVFRFDVVVLVVVEVAVVAVAVPARLALASASPRPSMLRPSFYQSKPCADLSFSARETMATCMLMVERLREVRAMKGPMISSCCPGVAE